MLYEDKKYVDYLYNDLLRKIRRKQISYTNSSLTGTVNGYVLGVDSSTGNIYYKDSLGEWSLASGGGSTNASDLTSGTLNDARLSANVVLTNAITSSIRQSILGYKNYSATLTQTSTSAPVVTILDDMFTSVSVARTGVGTYTFTKVGAWVLNKTMPLSEYWNDEIGNSFRLVRTSADVMTLTTYAYTNTLVAADGVLTDRFINIQVYN